MYQYFNRDAWNDLGSMSKEQAKQEYVDLVSENDSDWLTKVSVDWPTKNKKTQ